MQKKKVNMSSHICCVCLRVCVIHLNSPGVFVFSMSGSMFSNDVARNLTVLSSVLLSLGLFLFSIRFSLRVSKYSHDLLFSRLVKSMEEESWFLWNPSVSSRADICWRWLACLESYPILERVTVHVQVDAANWPGLDYIPNLNCMKETRGRSGSPKKNPKYSYQRGQK